MGLQTQVGGPNGVTNTVWGPKLGLGTHFRGPFYLLVLHFLLKLEIRAPNKVILTPFCVLKLNSKGDTNTSGANS